MMAPVYYDDQMAVRFWDQHIAPHVWRNSDVPDDIRTERRRQYVQDVGRDVASRSALLQWASNGYKAEEAPL